MKILVIRFSSIGDIVFTTPAIRCLKQQVPNAEVHFLSKQSFKAVTEANPYIDHFFFLQQ
jgi:ADP-heptose:LPS heptosyltransferase